MKHRIEMELAPQKKIFILPFVPDNLPVSAMLTKNNKKQYDFIYVASGEPHKNHNNLLLAWKILAEKGCYPRLGLTLDPKRDQQVYALMESINTIKGINIQSVGILPYESIPAFYASSLALIFPSFCESFGLPLIEAQKASIGILAPELDYVRDLLDPAETFDPHSPHSIARAVLRYLEKFVQPHPLLDASAFIQQVITYEGTS